MQHGGIVSTTLNTLCTMIGAGILSIPFAFAKCSVVVGCIVLPLSYFVSLATVWIYTTCCEQNQVFSFRSLTVLAFPNFSAVKLAKLIESLIVITNCSALAVYTKVIADSGPPVMASVVGTPGWYSERYVWIFSTALVFSALSIVKELHEIRLLSGLGFLCLLVVCVVIGVRYRSRDDSVDVSYLPDSAQHALGVFPSFSIFCGAFLYHMNIPTLYFELRDRTPARMMLTAALALSLALVLYVSVGLLGYLTFGTAEVLSGTAGGNILNCYDKTDSLINVSRALLVMHFVCAFPIYVVVARRSLSIIITGSHEEVTVLPRAVRGVTVVALAMALALTVPSIGILTSYSSALVASIVGITLPAVLGLHLLQRPPSSDAPPEASPDGANPLLKSTINAPKDIASPSSSILFGRGLFWFLLVFGVLSSAVSVFVTTVDLL